MNILVIGDSWSSAICVDQFNRETDRSGWPLLMGIPDNMRKAVAGSTAAQWSADFDGRLTKAANTQADAVILSLLGNDAFAIHNHGNPTFADAVQCYSNLNHVLSAVRKPRTIILQYSDPFGGKNPLSLVALPLLDAFIKGSVGNGIEVFDTRTVLKPSDFNGVNIHPMQSGHQAIADGLKKLLGLV